MATMFRILIQYGTEVLLSISKVPNDKILESLYKIRIRESDQLKTVLTMYEQEIDQRLSKPSCQMLKTMVNRHTGCFVGKDIFQRMIRTFRLGPLAHEGIFSRPELDPSVENVGKSQGKCNTMRRENARFRTFFSKVPR